MRPIGFTGLPHLQAIMISHGNIVANINKGRIRSYFGSKGVSLHLPQFICQWMTQHLVLRSKLHNSIRHLFTSSKHQWLSFLASVLVVSTHL